MQQKNILITGGAGFIGSHAIRKFVNECPESNIINFDALTYAGNLENLSDVESNTNYHFFKGDINNLEDLDTAFKMFDVNRVIHFAAESHVDRSISDPLSFLRTNIFGTVNLLEISKRHWKNKANTLFFHVSTDEVYGSLGETGYFTESTAYDPQSPYSASKASSDHFVRAYANTYGLKYKLSNCSNNYGPNQFPEKLIPLMINNIKNGKKLPVYGNGTNVRDWLYVEDHVDAIKRILDDGKMNETYNIGGNCEMSNIELVTKLCDIVDEKLGNEVGTSRRLITFVKDRPGHDHRYAIDTSKIERDLNWYPKNDLLNGLTKTVDWYLKNTDWLESVTSGSYKKYYENQYSV